MKISNSTIFKTLILFSIFPYLSCSQNIQTPLPKSYVAQHTTESIQIDGEAKESSWDKVSWKDTSRSKDKFSESALLKLNCDKALTELNWKPVLTFEETIKFTVEWYKKYYEDASKSMLENSEQQLVNYIKLSKKRGLAWAQ